MKHNLGKMFSVSKAAGTLLNKNGFTLVEVIVTLVIVMIAAVIAVPNVAGFVSSYQSRNCTARIESLLSGIESGCASNRFLTEDEVSANIISSAAVLDESVRDTDPSTRSLNLNDFCDENSDVQLSWDIQKQEDLSLFDVIVEAECEDGTKGERSFSCGLKETAEYSDKISLANRLVSQIINSEGVKDAYKNANVNSLAIEVSKASNIIFTEFSEAIEFFEGLDLTNKNVQMNAELSILLTVVINKNDSYADVFTSSFMGEDYMPVIVFTGDLKDDIYDSGNTGFSENAFILFGSRDMELTNYFSSDSIYVNGDTVEFNINCVWTPDLKNVYFLSVYESGGSPTYKKVSDVKSNYMTSSEWTKA